MNHLKKTRMCSGWDGWMTLASWKRWQLIDVSNPKDLHRFKKPSYTCFRMPRDKAIQLLRTFVWRMLMEEFTVRSSWARRGWPQSEKFPYPGLSWLQQLSLWNSAAWSGMSLIWLWTRSSTGQTPPQYWSALATKPRDFTPLSQTVWQSYMMDLHPTNGVM